MVFQTYALYPHMSVYENMSYGLKIQKVPASEIKRRVEAAAEILEISDLLDRQPRQISGGQRQRVAMGRAIVREPSVFLFDEPLSNLDAKLRVQMRLEIKKLQNRLGITSVYVTHDQVEAMTLGDRLMVMNAGVIEQFGTPIDLYQTPASLFVAGFIGSPSMNFLPATLDDTGRQILLDNGTGLKLPTAMKEGRKSAVTVGIRPEHLVVTGSTSSKINAGFDLAIDVVEQLGADTLVHGQLDGNSVYMCVRLPGVQSFDKGAKIKLSVDPANIHLFAGDTGLRLS
jgi:sn-glycerol 3-phosphate transport system ATP-binding protein